MRVEKNLHLLNLLDRNLSIQARPSVKDMDGLAKIRAEILEPVKKDIHPLKKNS